MNPNMSEAERDFRDSLKNELQNSEFPLNNPLEFSAALSNGDKTVISMGDDAIYANEIGVELSSDLSYPYQSTVDFIDDIVEVLKENNQL